MVILDNIELKFPQDTGRDFLQRVLGGKINKPMESLFEDKSSLCAGNIHPRAIFDRYEIEEVRGDKVFFRSGNVFSGPHISRILEGSKTAILYIYTLGDRVDRVINEERRSGDVLAAVIMDAITTSLLHILGEFVGERIKEEGIEHPGWGSTCTYSPGQYKWTIEEQSEIFTMIDGKRIGVELNDSFLMVPFKSVSGVYGFGPKEIIDQTRVACDLCPRADCIGRR